MATLEEELAAQPPTVGAIAPASAAAASTGNRYTRVPLSAAHRALVNPGPTVKLGFTMFGPPGTGKTTLGFMFPGRKLAISFEEKAEPIRINRFREDPNVRVINPFPLYADGQLSSYKEAQDVLEQLIPEEVEKFKPHWILLDDAEGVRLIANGYMRQVLDLPPVGGIDMNLWAERNAAMDRIMLLCKRLALMGAIASVYPEQSDESKSADFGAKRATKLEDGASAISGKTPKWFGKMMQHFPILLETSQAFSALSKNYVYRAHVVTCKEAGILRTGQTFEFTQRGDAYDPTNDPTIPWGPRMAELYDRANRLCGQPAPPWNGPRQVAPAPAPKAPEPAAPGATPKPTEDKPGDFLV